MFDKQYRFRGRHAVRVDALTSVFDSNSKAKLFDRNLSEETILSDEDALSTVQKNALKEEVASVLSKLTPKEERVLRLRYGFDGHERTLEEVGAEFNVTRERIRQIEGKALRKLRHPSKAKKLKEYY